MPHVLLALLCLAIIIRNWSKSQMASLIAAIAVSGYFVTPILISMFGYPLQVAVVEAYPDQKDFLMLLFSEIWTSVKTFPLVFIIIAIYVDRGIHR